MDNKIDLSKITVWDIELKGAGIEECLDYADYLKAAPVFQGESFLSTMRTIR